MVIGPSRESRRVQRDDEVLDRMNAALSSIVEHLAEMANRRYVRSSATPRAT